jgi:tetratricopeptide (TPR) repeat protein
MNNDKDLYEILEVNPSARLEVISAAFGRLVRIYHPNVNPDPTAIEKLRDITHAYSILSDPVKRQAYDYELRFASEYTGNANVQFCDTCGNKFHNLDEIHCTECGMPRTGTQQEAQQQRAEQEAERQRKEQEVHKENTCNTCGIRFHSLEEIYCTECGTTRTLNQREASRPKTEQKRSQENINKQGQWRRKITSPYASLTIIPIVGLLAYVGILLFTEYNDSPSVSSVPSVTNTQAPLSQPKENPYSMDNAEPEDNAEPDVKMQAASLLAHGKNKLNKNEFNEALDALNKSISYNPNALEAFYYRGVAYTGLLKYSEAIDDFTKAITMGMNEASVYAHRGAIHMANKKYSKAILDYGTALQLEPDNAHFSEQIEKATNYLDEAAKMSVKATTPTPYPIISTPTPVFSTESPRIEPQIGYDSIEKLIDDGNYSQAITELTNIINRNSGVFSDSKPYFLRGYAYYFKGDYREAIKDFSQVIATYPNSSLEGNLLLTNMYYVRGLSYYLIVDYASAIRDLEKVTYSSPGWPESNPRNPEEYEVPYYYGSHYVIGRIYLTEDKNDQAIKELEESININPSHGESYHVKGMALRETERYHEAVTAFTKSIELAPYPDSHYERGVLYATVENYEKAMEDFTSLLDQDYDNEHLAYFQIGKIYHLQQEYQSALENYEKAIAVYPAYEEPKNAELFYMAGLAAKMLGDNQSAILYYNEAIDINPDYDKAYCERGIAYTLTFQSDKALSDYEKTRASGYPCEEM